MVTLLTCNLIIFLYTCNQNRENNDDDVSQVSVDDDNLPDQTSEDEKNGNQAAVS